ncbi:hypothetical protein [Halosegnis longus]|uniref:hypothetical protein n=1 Tax=Halosegnis longus TaxID=2216012 RepID=UPI00129D81D9|nr:hypothetical protein [Halosegnis longus]
MSGEPTLVICQCPACEHEGIFDDFELGPELHGEPGFGVTCVECGETVNVLSLSIVGTELAGDRYDFWTGGVDETEAGLASRLTE